MDTEKYIPYCPFGPYNYVIIEYDNHPGIACDWEDCLEEIYFLDGYEFKECYIDYNDPKLTHFEPIMVKIMPIESKKDDLI